jgi:ureidoglycolate lyase
MTSHLVPTTLTAKAFAPFGDVIETSVGAVTEDMNSARFQRFNALATVDHDRQVNTIISIANCLNATQLPYKITLMERHPLSSQAFIPLGHFSFVVVVAPAGATVDPEHICAFRTNGEQGINYHRGIWHMPLIAFEHGQKFLIVDADESRPNCNEEWLAQPIWLADPADNIP